MQNKNCRLRGTSVRIIVFLLMVSTRTECLRISKYVCLSHIILLHKDMYIVFLNLI